MVEQRSNTSLILVTILTCLVPGFSSQTLYSASIYWVPTGQTHELQFLYHFSWTRQTIACSNPTCLQAYTTSHITVQNLNRWIGGYRWVCTEGCTGNYVISDLTNLLFAEIAGFSDDTWEAGEEILSHTFDPLDNIFIKLRFNHPNGTISTGLGDAMITIATRNDTNQLNASPSVTLMPIYRVPLGCTLVVDLVPFDGDGDDVMCRWSDVSGNLTSAKLDESQCKVTIDATRSNGFVADTFYRASLYIEDYSKTAVDLKHRVTVITRGPFSRSPVLLTVHVLKEPSDPAVCKQKPSFNDQTTQVPTGALTVEVPFTEDISFSSDAVNSSIMTVGPQGMLYNDDTNQTTITRRYSAWNVSDVTKMGVVRTCGMVYSEHGVPGEVRCLTYLINGTDECSTVTCNGHCTNGWTHYVCDTVDYVETADGDNTGLVIGLAVGLFALLVAIVTGVTIYLRRIWLQTHRIQSKGVAEKPSTT